MRLNAAESFRTSGDAQQARATLQSVDPTRLDALNQFTYYNMSALLAIDAHDYPAARQALKLAIPTDAASRNALALTVADLAEAEQRFEDAAASLMGYTFSSRDGDDKQFTIIVERTWSNVNRDACRSHQRVGCAKAEHDRRAHGGNWPTRCSAASISMQSASRSATGDALIGTIPHRAGPLVR